MLWLHTSVSVFQDWKAGVVLTLDEVEQAILRASDGVCILSVAHMHGQEMSSIVRAGREGMTWLFQFYHAEEEPPLYLRPSFSHRWT